MSVVPAIRVEAARCCAAGHRCAAYRRFGCVGIAKSEIREKLRSPSTKAPVQTSPRRGFRPKVLREDLTVAGLRATAIDFTNEVVTDEGHCGGGAGGETAAPNLCRVGR